jgi:hypothetical protein
MWQLYPVVRGLGPRIHEGVCSFKWKKLVGRRAKPGDDEKKWESVKPHLISHSANDNT